MSIVEAEEVVPVTTVETVITTNPEAEEAEEAEEVVGLASRQGRIQTTSVVHINHCLSFHVVVCLSDQTL